MLGERTTLTRQGYNELQRELQLLEERQRDYAAQLAELQREVGGQMDDEANEFDARVQKEYIDNRLAQLRQILNSAEIIDDDPDPQRVDLGDVVTIYDMSEDEETKFVLRSSEEVAYLGTGVSVESPVGAALLGRQIGDIIEVSVLDGVLRYQIKHIERQPTRL